MISDSVVQESARLSSGVFIVRYVTEDTKFTTDRGEDYMIRGGDRVAIYPPAFHKDPEIFEEPSVSPSLSNYLEPILTYYELHQPRLWFITGGYLVKR